MASMTLRGGKEMSWRLQTIAKKYPDEVGQAMHKEMEIEATEMKKRCPVDVRPNAPHPGNLRDSIHVEEPEQRGKTLYVVVATGAQAPYAIYVHENPDAFHEVGEWKFMESVLNESRSSMAERVGQRIHLNTIRI